MHDEKEYYINKLKAANSKLVLVEKSLKKAPEGSLRIANRKGKPQYYQVTKPGDTVGKYISVNEQGIIKALAQKDYDLRMQRILKKRIKAYKSIISGLGTPSEYSGYDEMIPARKQLVAPYYISNEMYINEWQKKEYTGNPYEYLHEYETEKGETVRSKSEKIIADKLYQMGIPYRYEYPLMTKDGKNLYPDFTLLNPHTLKEYYLEHFGMVDDQNYLSHAMIKLREYEKNGVFVGVNLLITWETADMPLNTRGLEQMLRAFMSQ